MDNIYDIIEEVQRVLNKTKDIDVINLVITAFEELEEGATLTKKFDLPLPSYDNQTIITQLDITKNFDVITNMFETCFELEEYEMCARIKIILSSKVINKT